MGVLGWPYDADIHLWRGKWLTMSEDSSLKGAGGALFAGVIMIMAGVFWALEGLAVCSRCVANTSMMHMCVDSA